MMKFPGVLDVFRAWVDTVAQSIVAATDRVGSPRRVALIETDDDAFEIERPQTAKSAAKPGRLRIVNGAVVEPAPPGLKAALRGSRVELVVRSSRFLFRALELPQRAAEFLDGIVRAQIDRITPWSAADAAFGWTPPREVGKERIAVTVGATARAAIGGYAAALANLGARSIAVSTAVEGRPGDESIKVLELRGRGGLDVNRVRSALTVSLLIAGLSALSAIAVDNIVGSAPESEKWDVLHQI